MEAKQSLLGYRLWPYVRKCYRHLCACEGDDGGSQIVKNCMFVVGSEGKALVLFVPEPWGPFAQ